jgi:hypothetical protein
MTRRTKQAMPSGSSMEFDAVSAVRAASDGREGLKFKA